MESEWAIAYRRKNSGDILNSEKQRFSLIKNTLRYWCADPFVVESESNTYIFFEAFDRLKRKGVIGYREIDCDRAGKIKIVLEEPFHLSYPYLYCENGCWYLIPESKDSNQIIRYQSKEFPDLWERETVLVEQIAAVDTTVLSHDGRDIELIIYLWESFNKGELQIIRIKGHELSIICKIGDPQGRKRPAGKLCRIGDDTYRPSQLCTRRYGEAVIFNKIGQLTDYEESEYKMVVAGDICLDRPAKIAGVHTYNASENWEVIDVEMIGFSMLRIFGLIPRIYHHFKRSAGYEHRILKKD